MGERTVNIHTFRHRSDTTTYRLSDVDLTAIDKEQKRRLAGDLPAVIPSARRAGWPVKLSPRS
jgi:hypothetical protein